MFICKKDKLKSHLNSFPTLFFSHIKYDYIFELTYEDLFKEIYDYYYFMVIFPNTYPDDYDINEKEEWHLGLPFLKKYQFVLNYDSKTIGFYKSTNLNYQKENNNNTKNEIKNIEGEKGIKVWLIILGILIVLILIIAAFFIGKLVNKQRKKRANEMKDDDFEYVGENFIENNDNKLINE